MVHLSVSGKQRTPHNAMLSFVQQKQEKREFMMNTSISRRQFLKASGLRSRPADWLRRLFLRQRFRRSLFRFRLQLHHPVRQPARYPELPDHRH